MSGKLPGVGVFGNSPAACLLASSLQVTAVCPLVLLLTAVSPQDSGFRVEAVWGRTNKEAEETSRALRVPFFTRSLHLSFLLLYIMVICSKIDDVLLCKDVDLIIIFCPPR